MTMKKKLNEISSGKTSDWIERAEESLEHGGAQRNAWKLALRVLDILEVPQRARRSGNYRRLAKLMAQLGRTAVRVRGVTRSGYLEQVRGFAREGHRSTLSGRDRAPAALNS